MLAGLDTIDAVFTDFVGSLDYIIRNGKTSESTAQLGAFLKNKKNHRNSQMTDGETHSGDTAEGGRGCSSGYVWRISDQSLNIFDTEGYVPLCHEGTPFVKVLGCVTEPKARLILPLPVDPRHRFYATNI